MFYLNFLQFNDFLGHTLIVLSYASRAPIRYQSFSSLSNLMSKSAKIEIESVPLMDDNIINFNLLLTFFNHKFKK